MSSFLLPANDKMGAVLILNTQRLKKGCPVDIKALVLTEAIWIDPSIGHPILPIAAEVCETFIVPQFLEVFMICFYPTSAQILYNT